MWWVGLAVQECKTRLGLVGGAMLINVPKARFYTGEFQ